MAAGEQSSDLSGPRDSALPWQSGAAHPIVARGLAIIGITAMVAFCVSVFTVPRVEGAASPFWDGLLPTAWSLTGAALILWRARYAHRLRIAWVLLAGYVLLNLSGDLLFNFVEDPDAPLTPSDWVYFTAYLCLGLALVILSRRGRSLSVAAQVDGLVIGITAVAVVLTFYQRNAQVSQGPLGDGGFSAVFPLMDLVFIAVALSGLVPLRFQLTRAVGTVYAGVALITIGDIVYTNQVADGTYTQGTWVELTWTFGAALLIVAAALPNSFRYTPRLAQRWTVAAPTVASFVAILLIARSLMRPQSAIVTGLALFAVALASIRLLLTMLELRRTGEGYEEARHDYLTGVLNRRGFQELLEDWLSDRRHGARDEQNRDGALLLIGVHGIKSVNDSFGHSAGDDVLRNALSRMDAATGRYPFARLTGDECAVLVTDAAELDDVREALRADLDRPVPLRDIAVRVRLSMGAAHIPRDGDDWESLMRAADIALTQSQRRRLDYVEFDAADSPANAERVALTADLHEGIERQELHLVFQPQVHISNGAVVGAEALVRWHHHMWGPVSPDEFIVAAEQAGLINRITRQVLTDTCQAWSGWRGQGVDIPVSMNISGYDLLDASLPDAVARSLADWNMPPDRLVLEITETALALDPIRAQGTMTALRALGVRTALDDFGSGYSSLAQVLITPVDEIKVDKRFMQEADPGRRLALTRAAVNLAQAIGAVAVVEGVETELDRQLLLRLDCAVAQGFLYSRPLTSDELVAYVQVHGTADWPEPTRPWAPAEFGAGGVISRAERRSSGG